MTDRPTIPAPARVPILLTVEEMHVIHRACQQVPYGLVCRLVPKIEAALAGLRSPVITSDRPDGEPTQ